MSGDPTNGCDFPWPGSPWVHWPTPFPQNPFRPPGWVGTFTTTFPASHSGLSDEDVDRIAKRLAEILKEGK